MRQEVENCTTLRIGFVMKRFSGSDRGPFILNWRRNGEVWSSVGLRISFEGDQPTALTLQWTRKEAEFLQEILLDSTQRMPKGGFKTYAICPFCGARCLTIHLPPHCERFGCRACYGLTYESSNESKWSRAFLRGLNIQDADRIFSCDLKGRRQRERHERYLSERKLWYAKRQRDLHNRSEEQQPDES
jgi:hypothetical protein